MRLSLLFLGLVGACIPAGQHEDMVEQCRDRFLDGDGDGVAGTAIYDCDAVGPNGEALVDEAGDCDDADGSVFPGAGELCDDLDNDCDTQVDEPEDAPEWYRDADGDGSPVEDDTQRACAQPEGYAQAPADGVWDCDDDDPDVSPGAVDAVCGDDVDQDCDGFTDCALSGEDLAAADVSVWSGSGSVVAAGGDLDGDGSPDGAVGDPDGNSVTALLGGDGWDNLLEVGLDLSGGGQLGASLAAVDGGLAIGQPGSNGGMGGVTVVYGVQQSGSVSGVGDVKGVDENSVFGRSLLWIGGDPSMWAASYDYDGGSITSSLVYVYKSLPTSPDGIAQGDYDFYLGGSDPHDTYPLALATGSLTGCADAIAVGAAAGGDGNGGAYLYCTLSGESPDYSLKVIGAAKDDDLGASLALLPDGTLAIGAPGVSDGAGALYLFGGLTGTSSDPDLADADTLSGSAGDALGTAISTAGDLNGDEIPDFAVGAAGAGRVDLYLGPPSAPTLLGSVSGPAGFGRAIASPGDLNADGFDDLLVASDANVYLLPGGPP